MALHADAGRGRAFVVAPAARCPGPGTRGPSATTNHCRAQGWLEACYPPPLPSRRVASDQVGPARNNHRKARGDGGEGLPPGATPRRRCAGGGLWVVGSGLCACQPCGRQASGARVLGAGPAAKKCTRVCMCVGAEWVHVRGVAPCHAWCALCPFRARATERAEAKRPTVGGGTPSEPIGLVHTCFFQRVCHLRVCVGGDGGGRGGAGAASEPPPDVESTGSQRRVGWGGGGWLALSYTGWQRG